MARDGLSDMLMLLPCSWRHWGLPWAMRSQSSWQVSPNCLETISCLAHSVPAQDLPSSFPSQLQSDLALHAQPNQARASGIHRFLCAEAPVCASLSVDVGFGHLVMGALASVVWSSGVMIRPQIGSEY